MYFINRALGSFRDFLERKGIIKEIPYKITCSKPRIQYEHPYPLNFREEDKPLFHSEHSYKSYSTTDECLFEMNDVCVSIDGIVFQKLKTSTRGLPHPVFRNTYGWLYVIGQRLFRKRTKTDASVSYVLTFDHWSKINYYHWIVDSLPRILLAKKNSTDPVFLLPENPPHFITASLKELGIEKVRFIRKNEYLSFEKLYVQQYAAAPGQHHKLLLAELRSAFLQKNTSPVGTGKIYVSRGKQAVRKIANEDPLLEIVKKEGFRVVYFEDHTLAEQIAIMRTARILVSSHGANMTNMLFMPENATIFELIRNDQPNFCYWSMSNSLRYNYYYQLCQVADKDNIMVDVEEFKNNLQEILKA
jgi:capsular polysaccharide biosynthesis protein